MPYVIRQFLKNRVNTSIPGIVVSYEPLTRRAVVQVALNTLLTNGLALSGPLIPNIPVIYPAGGGFQLVFPLHPGDTALLLFSKRGIRRFKESFEREDLCEFTDDLKVIATGRWKVKFYHVRTLCLLITLQLRTTLTILIIHRRSVADTNDDVTWIAKLSDAWD